MKRRGEESQRNRQRNRKRKQWSYTTKSIPHVTASTNVIVESSECTPPPLCVLHDTVQQSRDLQVIVEISHRGVSGVCD